MILVVDYGMGNIGSIANMMKKAGGDALISGDPRDLTRASKIILPGVGAFDQGVKNLKQRGLWDALTHAALDDRRPVLGICLGMQLFTRSSEEGNLPGLGWLDATTVRFRANPSADALKIPHMGWNQIATRKSSPLLEGMYEDPMFYFVHSYHVLCADPSDVLAVTTYGYEFPSSLQRGNLYATQFHPEKSHKYGLRLIQNFIERV
jgi:imidazole glycerol-phosphate synthase subunit HisH